MCVIFSGHLDHSWTKKCGGFSMVDLAWNAAYVYVFYILYDIENFRTYLHPCRGIRNDGRPINASSSLFILRFFSNVFFILSVILPLQCSHYRSRTRTDPPTTPQWPDFSLTPFASTFNPIIRSDVMNVFILNLFIKWKLCSHAVKTNDLTNRICCFWLHFENTG